MTARVQYSVRFLFAIVMLSCIAALWVREARKTRPIRWERYTEERLDAMVDAGSTVLVFSKPGLNPDSYFASMAFDHPTIRRSFHSGRFKALICEYKDYTAEANSFFDRFGYTKRPIAVLLSPDRKPVAIDPRTSDEILRHIPIASSTLRNTIGVTLALFIAYFGFLVLKLLHSKKGFVEQS